MSKLISTIFDIAVIAFLIWTLYKICTHSRLSVGQKILYFLAVLFIPAIGLILFWLVGNKSSESRRSISSSDWEDRPSSSSSYPVRSSSPSSGVSTSTKSTTSLLAHDPEDQNYYRDAPKLYTLPDVSDAFLITDPFMCWGGWLEDEFSRWNKTDAAELDRIRGYAWIAEDEDEKFHDACCQAGYPDCYRTRASIRESLGVASVCEELSDGWMNITIDYDQDKRTRMEAYFYNNPNSPHCKYTACGFIVRGISIEAARSILSIYRSMLDKEGYKFR